MLWLLTVSIQCQIVDIAQFSFPAGDSCRLNNTIPTLSTVNECWMVHSDVGIGWKHCSTFWNKAENVLLAIQLLWYLMLPWLVSNIRLENDVNDLHNIWWVLVSISFEVILHSLEIELVHFLEVDFTVPRLLLTGALDLCLKSNIRILEYRVCNSCIW